MPRARLSFALYPRPPPSSSRGANATARLIGPWMAFYRARWRPAPRFAMGGRWFDSTRACFGPRRCSLRLWTLKAKGSTPLRSTTVVVDFSLISLVPAANHHRGLVGRDFTHGRARIDHSPSGSGRGARLACSLVLREGRDGPAAGWESPSGSCSLAPGGKGGRSLKLEYDASNPLDVEYVRGWDAGHSAGFIRAKELSSRKEGWVHMWAWIACVVLGALIGYVRRLDCVWWGSAAMGAAGGFLVGWFGAAALMFIAELAPLSSSATTVPSDAHQTFKPPSARK